MAKAIYNPKFFISGGIKVLNTADIKRFIWSHASWDLKANEMKKFPDEVGEALLRHYEFLVEVTPKNLKEVKGQMTEKKFKCDSCAFETDTKVALITHKRAKHGATEEQMKDFSDIDEASPSGKFQGFGQPIKKTNPEEQEGIPSTVKGNVKDNDGVEWYGDGVQKDTV